MTPNHLNGERPAGKSPGASSTLDVADALRAMRSRSPEESLGVKGEPGLLKSSIQAGVVTAVLFALLGTGLWILGAFLFNLLSDLVGGVQVWVLEEVLFDQAQEEAEAQVTDRPEPPGLEPTAQPVVAATTGAAKPAGRESAHVG